MSVPTLTGWEVVKRTGGQGYFDPMSFDEIMEMFINGKFRTY